MSTRRSISPILALALLGCSHASKGNASLELVFPAPFLSAEQTATVDVLTAGVVQGRPVGVLVPVRLSVRPSRGKGSVSVGEEYLASVGEQLRSSFWMAGFYGATFVGRELTDYDITVAVPGHVDGPSAGALVTATVMALMSGVPVRSEVTMTGALNHDGSIGPVGGVLAKFEAALAANKRVLGYPVGQRRVPDPQGKLIDLQELAESRGASAEEVSNVYEAFQLLTGRPFPRPYPVSAEELRPEPAVWRAFDQIAERELEDVRQALRALETGPVSRGAAHLAAMSKDAQRRAEAAKGKGLLFAALHFARWAEALAQVAAWSNHLAAPFAGHPGEIEQTFRRWVKPELAEQRRATSVLVNIALAERRADLAAVGRQHLMLRTVGTATGLLGAFENHGTRLGPAMAVPDRHAREQATFAVVQDMLFFLAAARAMTAEVARWPAPTWVASSSSARSSWRGSSGWPGWLP